jgi:hypothetical protein
MQSRQWPQVLLATTLFFSLTDRASVAFNIIPEQTRGGKNATNSYNALANYYVGSPNDFQGLASLDTRTTFYPPTWLDTPGAVINLKRGGTPGVYNALRRYQKLGWKFQPAKNDLNGSFSIVNYYACGAQTECGKGEIDEAPLGTVGAFFNIKYHPKSPDPRPGNGKLHWIQRVVSNHDRQVRKHGRLEDLIDIGDNNTTTPYYDTGTPYAGEDFLTDRPYRVDLLNNHYWFAELYLVEETATRRIGNRTVGDVTIYNGVRWGWKNIVTRRKQPVPVPAPVPAPTPNPIPFLIPCPPDLPKIPNLDKPIFGSASSGGGGIGCVAVSRSPTPSPTPRPSPRPAPAPSPRPAPAPSPRPAPAPSRGGRPIRAVPSSWIPNAKVSNLRSSSLFGNDSIASTDYLAATSSDLLEDPELSSTDNSLNNANLANISSDLLENPELSSTDSNENQVNLANISSDLLENPELSSTDSNENQVNLADISSELLEDPELSSTDNDENNADIGSISADLLEDPELSSEDNNYNEVDLAGISADLLEDPELSYQDDTLTAKTPKVSSKNTDDALSAEAVPEPTTGLGTLLAASVLPVIKRLTNRKNQE